MLLNIEIERLWSPGPAKTFFFAVVYKVTWANNTYSWTKQQYTCKQLMWQPCQQLKTCGLPVLFPFGAWRVLPVLCKELVRFGYIRVSFLLSKNDKEINGQATSAAKLSPSRSLPIFAVYNTQQTKLSQYCARLISRPHPASWIRGHNNINFIVKWNNC